MNSGQRLKLLAVFFDMNGPANAPGCFLQYG